MTDPLYPESIEIHRSNWLPPAQFPPTQSPAAQFPPAQFPPAQFPAAQFPRPQARRRVRAATWAALVASEVVFFAAGLGVGLVLKGSSSTPVTVVAAATSPSPSATPSPTPPPAPALFKVLGTLTLSDSRHHYANDKACEGSGGYDDIQEGAQVVIYDNAGTALSIGRLQAGIGDGTHCIFGFEVDNVPSGKGPYSVEISHRGTIAFTQSEAFDVELTLGS